MTLKHVFTHLFHPHHSNRHRPGVLHPEAFAYFMLMALGFVFLVRSSAWWLMSSRGVLGFASSITVSDVVRQTNAQRTAQGLVPLTVNEQLNQAALAKAQDMMNKQYWAHIAPDGTEPWSFFHAAGYQYRVAGENLARDFGNTEDMVKAWMASPTHRANVVNDKYQEIGIAVVDGDLLGYETTLVVQLFGTPTQPVAQLPADAAPAIEQQNLVAAESESAPLAVSRELTAPPQPAVLAEGSQLQAWLPMTSLTKSPVFSPLQLIKAFFLAMIMLIMSTLLYDTMIIGHYATIRMVGKNFAHILLLMAVAFLLIFFKGGIIG